MDTMEIDDLLYTDKSLVTEVDFRQRKQPYRCVTVCLGILCTVLLAGNIGQMVFYEIISHPASTNPTQGNYNALSQDKDHLQNDNGNLITEKNRLQSSYNALTVEIKQLEIKQSNLTKEKEELQKSYISLTSERDEFKASFNNVKNDRDQLQASYNSLKQESNQLQTSYNDMQRSLEELQAVHSNLTAINDQLRTKYSDLQREKDDLHSLFIALVRKKDQLESNYSSLRSDKDQLLRSYNRLNTSKNLMEISYNLLWKDKDLLQMKYNTLRKANERLQNYSSLTSRGQLQKDIDELAVKIRGMPCQTNWRKFDLSCYFVSTMKKNWTESRRACIAEGADLLIIDSRDEESFVNGLLDGGQNAWIGFTDSLQEGSWMWVDGTPVTTTDWQPGQPNSFSGNQDCGEFVHTSDVEVGNWNDDGCFAEQIWICEK